LRDRRRVSVNADMVAKWERGAKTPSRRYRELLYLLFGVDTSQLGIGKFGPGAGSPATHGVPSEDGPLAALFADVASLLNQLGAAGAILQPKMFEIWRDELMHRRAVLKLLGVVPAAGFTAADERRQPSRTTPEAVDDLDQLADRYQALYHSTAPAVLLTPVVAHLQTLRELLLQGVAPPLRRKLFANRPRVATLAGRISYFDLSDPMSARGYYNLALEAACEAGDHLQAAAALGHIAFIPAGDHSFHAALDYLRGAAGHVRRFPHSRVESWLSAVESEMQTNAGNPKSALAAVDRARELAAPPGLTPALAWFDYYDGTRLAGFAGYALLRAARFDEARMALSGAVASLPRTAVKQRAVFLTDLATVELHDGERDQACRIAGDAAEQLQRAGYATGSGRLRDFRRAVEPWSTSFPVRMLDEQLAAVV
jgi:tetratricopeptide (TPR) repeat protein